MTEELDVKSRAVRAAAREIGIGERWITKEYHARKFAAEIIAAIERAGITLVDANIGDEYGADHYGEMLVYETFNDAWFDLDNRPNQEDQNVYRRRRPDPWVAIPEDEVQRLARGED